MTSKYDGYWEGLRAELQQMVDDAAAGRAPVRDCADIRTYGERQSWYGVARLRDGRLIERTPNAAHLASLDDLARDLTRSHPGRRFQFRMNRDCLLTVTCAGPMTAASDPLSSNIPVGELTSATDEPENDIKREQNSRPRRHRRGAEDAFADALVALLQPMPGGYRIETRKSLIYSLTVEPDGHVPLGMDGSGAPVRGGNIAYQQDILVYEAVEGRQTSVIPLVVAEVKYRSPDRKHAPGVTTHDALTYGEKAGRIKEIYPYARYGFILGGLELIPRRIVRLSRPFDFVVALPSLTAEDALDEVRTIFHAEIEASLGLRSLMSGQQRVKRLHRQLVWGS